MAYIHGNGPPQDATTYQQQPMVQTTTDWFGGIAQNVQEPSQEYDKTATHRALSGLDASEQQLLLLQEIRDQLVLLETRFESRTTKTQFIWNAFLQIVGLLIGVAFGAFAILSYSISQTANSQSFVANQLAVLNLCLTAPDATVANLLCGAISQVAATALPSLAVAAFGPSATHSLPPGTPPPITSTRNTSSASVPVSTGAVPTSSTVLSTPTVGSSPGSNAGSSSGVNLQPYGIIGIVLGVVAFISIVISALIFVQRFRKRGAWTKPSG